MQLKLNNKCRTRKSFRPEHPQADSDGYVYKAAVNVDQEMVEMMEAGRQYQNNIEVFQQLELS